MNLLSELSAPARQGVRANLAPGLILQTFALALVLAYAFLPTARTAFDVIGSWKEQGGYAFSAVSTALFGGIIPFAVLWFSRLIPPNRALPTLLFYIGFWIWKGIEVDAFYRAQAQLFGHGSGADVIVPKVLFDQFVYNPLWAAPTQAFCFLYKDSDFRLSILRARLRAESFPLRIAVVLVSTWVVWIPAVAIIYSLPSALQIPLFNLVLCFWSLLLSFVSRGS